MTFDKFVFYEQACLDELFCSIVITKIHNYIVIKKTSFNKNHFAKKKIAFDDVV